MTTSTLSPNPKLTAAKPAESKIADPQDSKMQSGSNQQKDYYSALDGIRGFGIFLVLLAHYRLFYLSKLTPESTWEKVWIQLVDFNWISMEWFFAMSGFLITGILLKTKTQTHYFKTFFARRFLRIFPLYYGFLAFYFFVLPKFMDLRANPQSAFAFTYENQAWYWTYLANYLLALQGTWLGEMSHFWSLAVEEHFYLVWPFLVYFLSSKTLKKLALLGIAASLALRFYFVFEIVMSPISVYVMTITRMDSLLMGSLLALVLHEGSKFRGDFSPLLRLRRPLTWASALIVPLLIYFYAREGHFSVSPQQIVSQQQGHLYPWVQTLGYFLVAITACSLIVWLLTGSERNLLKRFFELRLFSFWGQLSYGMYIIHFAVFGLFHESPLSTHSLESLLGSRALATLVGFTVPYFATVLGAWLLWHGFEKPILQLKKYFEYSGKSRTAPNPAGAVPASIAMASLLFGAGGVSGNEAYAAEIQFRSSAKIITGFEAAALATESDQGVNPGNRLELPRYQATQDFRPVFKLDTDAGVSATIKPRFQWSGTWSYVGAPGTSQPETGQQKGKFDWMEAFAQWQLGDSFTLGGGIQNYQWGPGELFSPSNEVFRFLPENQYPLFYMPGRNIVRASWTPNKRWNLGLVAEIAKSGNLDFQFGQTASNFPKKLALKIENTQSWGTSAHGHTAALILGTDEAQAHWLGQTLQVTLWDRLHFYVDASEDFRNFSFAPNTQSTPGLTTMDTREEGDRGLWVRVLGGLRYQFERGHELRAEYLYNGLGYTREQYLLALDTFAPNYAGGQALAQRNLARFLSPGLEFRGQHYGYISGRIGDLGHDDPVTLFLRYFHNFTDQSGVAMSSLEWSATQSLTLLAAISVNRGELNTELAQIDRLRTQLALRFDL